MHILRDTGKGKRDDSVSSMFCAELLAMWATAGTKLSEVSVDRRLDKHAMQLRQQVSRITGL